MILTDLFPHNLEAVKAVNEAFKTKQRVAVVHATGTGKSYIIAKVADNYKKVLVIAPNNFVLNETRKVCHEGCEFRTYASVMYDEGDKGKYDLIVLDEFHRGGAEKWGDGVSRLIAVNPQAKLLGTSATEIRYLDNQRNMADELFDGNVVSRLTIGDAIGSGILPNPTYVSSIYTMKDTIDSRKRLYNSKKHVGLNQEEICRKLDGIAHRWEDAGGVPAIIRKYFNHDMQRVIVFCSKVRRASEARNLLGEWFGKAGFNRVRYYNIDYTEKRLESEMADFQAPMGQYDLKVAISVNMLNEGIHVPRVDGIIMLRSTISRIIIEQQVGRCLTCDNCGITPVILDLVNNMDSINYVGNDFTCENEHGDGEPDGYKFPFDVIDEIRDLRILLMQLDKEFYADYTYNECKEEATKCSTKTQFHRDACPYYRCSLRNGWIDEFYPPVDRVTDESALAMASQCENYNDYIHKFSREYEYLKRNKKLELLRNAFGFKTEYTFDECKAEADKYKSRASFLKNSGEAYNCAVRHGWLDKIKPAREKIGKLTLDVVLEKAKLCSTRREFRLTYTGCYKFLGDNGLLGELDKVFPPEKKKVTKEDIAEVAKKYTRRSDFWKYDVYMYSTAKRRGILNEVCAHMKTPPKKAWNRERLEGCARKYKTKYQWRCGDANSYFIAQRRGILNEICDRCGLTRRK